MSQPQGYEPPEVWTWEKESGGEFASINRPTAGPRHQAELPVGEHPIQLYSLGTPNGQKVTIMLEELLERGVEGAEYDAHLINILEGEQFSSGFVKANPNSKIPAMRDHSVEPAQRVFESGSILLYLADKFGEFIPEDGGERAECLSWLFWQMGSAPYVGGGFGHFFAYAPEPMEYPIDRFTMETKRQLDVLNRRLKEQEYVAGVNYTIADMAIWPWYGELVRDNVYDGAGTFLDVQSYEHVRRWADQLAQRPAVDRGSIVNKTWGPEERQLHERHDASDFELRTQDKIGGDSADE